MADLTSLINLLQESNKRGQGQSVDSARAEQLLARDVAESEGMGEAPQQSVETARIEQLLARSLPNPQSEQMPAPMPTRQPMPQPIRQPVAMEEERPFGQPLEGVSQAERMMTDTTEVPVMSEGMSNAVRDPASLLEQYKQLQERRANELAEAQRKSNIDRHAYGAMQAGSILSGRGMNPLIQQRSKDANLPVEQLKERTAEERSAKNDFMVDQSFQDKMQKDIELKDPNSLMSKVYKDLLTASGFKNVPGNLTAAQIEPLLPMQLKLKALEVAKAKAQEPKLSKLDEFREKEKIKEDVKIKSENRKEASSIKDDIKTTESLLEDIKEAKKAQKAHKGLIGLGTGPLQTLGGLTKSLSPEEQKLDALYKKMNLDTMVKMFAGMSKAVDSDAERRAFEAAQPNLANYRDVNMGILDKREKIAKDLLKKQKEALKNYDRHGNFTEQQTQSQPQGPTPGSIVRMKDGKRYRVAEDGDTLTPVEE